jgi:hypothetical protein
MDHIGFSETLVENQQPALRNIPEDRTPQLHSGASFAYWNN